MEHSYVCLVLTMVLVHHIPRPISNSRWGNSVPNVNFDESVRFFDVPKPHQTVEQTSGTKEGRLFIGLRSSWNDTGLQIIGNKQNTASASPSVKIKSETSPPPRDRCIKSNMYR